MAYQPIFKMSIQDSSNRYYKATQGDDGEWAITLLTTPTYLRHLPKGCNEDVTIEYERDNNLIGVFRGGSLTNKPYGFVKDGRAIITHIWKTQGIRGFGKLTIYIRQDTESTPGALDFWRYEVFYASDFDFTTYNDNLREEILMIGTLDNGLIRQLHAYGGTQYNIPIWRNDGTPGLPDWQLNDSVKVLHPGIKLLYNSSYKSAATISDPINYGATDHHELYGWNHGSLTDGYHIIPAMNNYSTVQANGATTFIGNDILQPFLIQGNQMPGAANFASESNFHDLNHSRPYTTNNFVLKNLLDIGDIDVAVGIDYKFTDDVIGTGVAPSVGDYVAFVLFEIDKTDNPEIVAGAYVHPQEIHRIELGPSPSARYRRFRNFDNPTPITLKYDRVYVLGIIYDTVSGVGGSGAVTFGLDILEISIRSKFDSGVSGVPIPAPHFPASWTAGFRINTLAEKIVPCFATRNTDGYGFPLPVSTPYSFHSDYLSNRFLPAVQDLVPYRLVWTSAYCLHNLAGQSYVTASFDEVFNFCKRHLGCGMAIEGDVVRVEPVSYFFDATTMILDLGDNVADLAITPETTGLGSTLKIGYSKADTNSDFGVDAFNTSLNFDTPILDPRGEINLQESSVVTEQYAIEKIRAQRVSQPIGSEYGAESPSKDNKSVLLYCEDSIYAGSAPVFVDPSNFSNTTGGYLVQQYANAQSADRAASANPYIYGMYYPDTALNLPLSPCRSLHRGIGSWLHSVLDTINDADYLTFRNTYIMQYNNTVTALSGIESNLAVGSGLDPITEFKDIQIGSLPDVLFLPALMKFTTKTPVNMYKIMNTNTRGYVRFEWKGKEYKGFIKKVAQNAGRNAPSTFELLPTPDMIL